MAWLRALQPAQLPTRPRRRVLGASHDVDQIETVPGLVQTSVSDVIHLRLFTALWSGVWTVFKPPTTRSHDRVSAIELRVTRCQ